METKLLEAVQEISKTSAYGVLFEFCFFLGKQT